MDRIHTIDLSLSLPWDFSLFLVFVCDGRRRAGVDADAAADGELGVEEEPGGGDLQASAQTE